MTKDAHGAEATEPSLLLVDDDASFRAALGAARGRRGFAVTLAASAEEGAARAKEQVFEYALVDVRMPGASGIDLVSRLRALDDGTRVVVLTGYGTIANAIEAMRAGAFEITCVKPADAAQCDARAPRSQGTTPQETSGPPERAARRVRAFIEGAVGLRRQRLRGRAPVADALEASSGSSPRCRRRELEIAFVPFLPAKGTSEGS